MWSVRTESAIASNMPCPLKRAQNVGVDLPVRNQPTSVDEVFDTLRTNPVTSRDIPEAAIARLQRRPTPRELSGARRWSAKPDGT